MFVSSIGPCSARASHIILVCYIFIAYSYFDGSGSGIIQRFDIDELPSILSLNCVPTLNNSKAVIWVMHYIV